MTQMDLPQLSLQRYLDLVKRRRWQLVPVSLLGLLVGGMIAFFIPRYFVASTLLVHQPVPGGGEAPTERENPFRAIVDTAKSTIPLAIGEALDQMKWPDAQFADRYQRAQYERGIESRLSVQDSNVWDLRRTYAQLSVTYRDLDGERAASFLNTLVTVWIKKRLAELREPAAARREQAKNTAEQWRRTYDQYSEEKRSLENTYGIKPNYSIDLQREEYPKLLERQRQQQEALEKKQVELATLEATLAADRDRLAGTDRRVPVDSAAMQAQAAATPEGKKLLAQLLVYTIRRDLTFRPGTAAWHQAQRGIDMVQEQLNALVPKGEVDAEGLVPNPDYEQLAAAIAAAELRRTALAAEVALSRQAFDAERARLENLADGYRLYDKKLKDLQEADESRKAANHELRLADGMLAQLTSQLPVQQIREALVPPRPTEPNILIVALIGCVLGLGVAIGLILLLDFAQGTFKTIEDVERGVAVPVLGGISHLETDVERRSAARGRRRASLAAAAVLALVTIVVTIFYVDPTRLPPVVRDLLAMLLGA